MKELLKECYDELANLNGLVVKSEGVDCQFDELLDKLSKEIIKPNKTIAEYYTEWENNIEEIDTKTKELLDLKETYNQMEQDIIDNTDFKELYGANNQKVRDNHVKNELKDMVEQKQTLELRIDYLKRRIDFIKSIVKARLFTVYGVGE